METSFHLPQVVGVLAALLLIAAATLAFTKRIDQPFSVGLVAFGVFLDYGPESLAPFNQYGVSQEVILFVFLPTLLFESAFNLDVRQVRHNLLPVLTVPNEMDIRYAVRLLSRFGASRGLVVDHDRKLVGLVTLRDMVLAYVHQDEVGVEA